MNNITTIFRLGIAVEVLCFFGLLLLGFLAPEETNEEILRRMDSGLYQSLDIVLVSSPDTSSVYIPIGLMAIILLLIAVVVLVYLGLFLFWNWARFLNLFLYIVGFVITPFLGWTIMPPLDSALSEFATVLGGAILATSFLSPVAERFERQKAEQGAAANP